MDTGMSTRLIQDTIVVKTAQAVYLYAQATRKVARVRRLDSTIQSYLAGQGFFNPIPREMHYRPRKLWAGLMLLMSRACPLACRYCYADGGCSDVTMSPEMAERIFKVYLSIKPRRPQVTFFGGGEPTLGAAAIKHLVAKYGDQAKWQVTTSGVLSGGFLHWLIEHGVNVTVSVDGPPKVQDDLRPLRGGGASSPIVERTLRTLVASGRAVGVRATVTRESLAVIDEVLDYFQQIGVQRVHFEALYSLGRAIGSGVTKLTPLDVEDQAQLLLTSMNWAKATGKQVKMGGLSYLFHPGVAGYCGAIHGRTMVVNHLGQLTACSEVVDGESDDWPMFNLGYVDDQCHLHVDERKLTRFRQRVVTNMEVCRECFARYICRGGCAHRAWSATGDVFRQGDLHCDFIRSIVPILIQRMAVSLPSGGNGKSREGGGD